MMKVTSCASIPLVCLLASMGSLAAPMPALAARPIILAQAFLNDLGNEPDDAGVASPDEPSLDAPKATPPGSEDEVLGAEPQLKPDVKPGADPFAPPQSARDSKSNKLDLQLGDQPGDVAPTEPVDRPKMLAELYEKLGEAKNATAAQPIMKAIEDLWTESGSDTIDLLMSRAAQFANREDADLSLAILDAVVDIAPQDAEAWYLRAKVHIIKGQPERAIADFRRALSIDPKHYKASNDLGLVLEEIGAKKEALKAYRKALEVNPFLDDARQGVEALKREVEGQDI
jgi:tetratricopeptide (TPR) repeat protein